MLIKRLLAILRLHIIHFNREAIAYVRWLPSCFQTSNFRSRYFVIVLNQFSILRLGTPKLNIYKNYPLYILAETDSLKINALTTVNKLKYSLIHFNTLLSLINFKAPFNKVFDIIQNYKLCRKNKSLRGLNPWNYFSTVTILILGKKYWLYICKS